VKVAVYTIALNEEKHVERWYNSVKDADYILIADTGSTDRTVEIAKSLGINAVNALIKPFRFDTSRNAALAALPADIDYCISLDMDEVLTEGWRADIETLVPLEENQSAVLRSTLTWNFREDGTPGLQYGADRIHSRWGVTWRQPAHEIISTYGDYEEKRGWVGFGIHHLADATKSRGQYMAMLKMAVQENPHSDRNAFYYARELYFYGLYSEAAKEFKRHLELPTAVWRPERAASLRYLAICEPINAETHLVKAVATDPSRREAKVALAQEFYKKNDWANCYKWATDALQIETKPLDYMCEEFAWNHTPYDLAALASYNLGKFDEAFKYGTKAVELAPEDERLVANLAWYSSALS
jgi:glycosyltransferase involved in cell wall biosynthesis